MWRWGERVLLGAAVSAMACRAEPPPAPDRSAAPEAAAVVETRTLPERPLRIAKTPVLGSKQARDYSLFTQYLAGAIGHSVEVVVADSYTHAIDLVAEGQADLALISPLAFVKAKERLPQLRPLVSILRDGQRRYRAYIVVRDDSGLRSLAQLKGRRVALGDESSTSGNLFPLAMLREAGLGPGDYTLAVRHPDHRDIMQAVVDRRVEAGAISSQAMSRAFGNQRGIRILAKSEWIQYDPFVAHPRVPGTTAEALKAALLQLSTRTDEGRQILGPVLMITGFIPVDDSAYDPIRRVRAARTAP